MSDDNNAQPHVPRSHIQFILEGGAGIQTNTTLTPDECVAELDTKGGSGRVGYAVIPTIPKPGNKAETLRIWRQKIIGFVVVDLEKAPESRIFVPQLVPPNDIVKG